MKNMSFKIKFYELYLKEKDDSVTDYAENKVDKSTLLPKQINEIYIHHFLNIIVEDIEIVVKNEDNEPGEL